MGGCTFVLDAVVPVVLQFGVRWYSHRGFERATTRAVPGSGRFSAAGAQLIAVRSIAKCNNVLGFRRLLEL